MKKIIFPVVISLVLTCGTTVAFAGEYEDYDGNSQNMNNSYNSYDDGYEQPDSNVYAKQEQEPTRITMQNFNFNPVVITINPGTTVQWNNQDTTPDAIVGDGEYGPRSGEIETGESYDYRYTESGTYRYHGSRNPQATGTVIVVDTTPRDKGQWHATPISSNDKQYCKTDCAEKCKDTCQGRQGDSKCYAKESGSGKCATPPANGPTKYERNDYNKGEYVAPPPPKPVIEVAPPPAPTPAPAVSTVSAAPSPTTPAPPVDKGGASEPYLPSTGAAGVVGVAAIFVAATVAGAALYQLFVRRKI